MLVERLQKAWRERAAGANVHETLGFEADGLVLGAGTILVGAGDMGCASNLEGGEARLLTLQTAAHGRPVGGDVLGHIRRAARRWDEGQRGQADLHLALTRLPRLTPPREAARRLFMADALMRAGLRPDAILKALDIEIADVDPTFKFYNPQQPRVPAGNGRVSGQWTRVGVLADLSAADLVSLGLFAARFVSPVAALGVVFIPTNKSIHVRGVVAARRALDYDWNRDESRLALRYLGDDGRREAIEAQVDRDGVLRDDRRRAIGRLLPGDRLAIDLAAVSPDLVDRDKPNLCPSPSLDRPGARSKDQDYEDFVKRVVNPENPTPRGFGVSLLNPVTGNTVVFDDCQHETGAMIDAKGTTYAKLLTSKYDSLSKKIVAKILKQALRQVEASKERPIIWYFAESSAANEARKFFKNYKDDKLKKIDVEFLPYPEHQ